MQLTIKICLIFSILTLNACGTFGPEKSLFGENRVTTASANQLIDKNFESFDDVGLILMIDPQKDITKYTNKTEAEKTKLLYEAFAKANGNTNEGEDISKKRRSQIQDRLIAASNQRCNLYGTYLTRVGNYNNGIFGTASTILGGAGAIVTGEQAARVLSGLAGISSGTRSELNQAIFESVASSIIMPGIEKSRKIFYADIITKRSKTMQEYTIEGAIADAIAYHGLCSINTGIDYAHKVLQLEGNIGLDTLEASMSKISMLRSVTFSNDLAIASGLESANDALNKFKTELANLKSKITAGDTKYDAVSTIITGLETDSADAGSLAKQAKEFDEKMQKELFKFSTADSISKTASFSSVRTLAIEIKNYRESLEAKMVSLQKDYDLIKK